MSVSRRIIDSICEEKEVASVKVEVTGSPASVQRALKKLARDPKKLAKAATGGLDADKIQVGDAGDDEDEGKGKGKDKGDDKAKDKDRKSVV
jgi:hypothetical protein